MADGGADGGRPGFGTVTAYLLTDDAGELLEFIHEAFDAEVLTRLDRADGTLMHAEAQIGDTMIMLGEPTGDLEPMPASLFVYVDDCDQVFSRALDSGGSIVMQPTTMRHAGQRYGGVADPVGNIWWIATHLEDVDPEEEQQRIDEMTAAGEAPFEEET